MPETANPFHHLVRKLDVNGVGYQYYDLTALNDERLKSLPFCIRVLLESAVRCCDEFQVRSADVHAILDWQRLTDQSGNSEVTEVPFKPARVILQDFTGVPAVVDFAAMRDAVERLGGDARRINPVCPADLVIDHSVQVDYTRASDALEANQTLEFERNEERFKFLKWGSQSFDNMLIIPPGCGIVHQVNLEYLARVVFKSRRPDVAGVTTANQRDDDTQWLYPDSVVGTDSHTTMINGLGVVGWGVGGIEAEAVMLGQSVSMVLPRVLGYRITGRLHQLATSTDVVLTITKHLRQVGVVGQFVEFFGDGVASLSIADRATISNMCPEYGATVGYFPVDCRSLEYLRQTGRSSDHIAVIEAYLRAVHLLRDYSDQCEDPVFSQQVELDLSSVVPSVSGPKRPHDRVAVVDMPCDFSHCLTNPVGFKGYGLSEERVSSGVDMQFDGRMYRIQHGCVVIAAITSCTNTSNPSVMLGAGVLARKAVQRGLSVAPWIKTSLSPGSGVVTHYLRASGVMSSLQQLGFDVVGYGCMTCIGNSGPLPDPVVEAIEQNDLVCCGVLSGNRNFEGRIHPHVRANYLASPPLVVAYAIAGRVDIDFETTALGHDPSTDTDVYLRDIWPSRDEIQSLEVTAVIPAMFNEVYSKISQGNTSWNNLVTPDSLLYPWSEQSTYIQRPPFFDNMTLEVPVESSDIDGARALLVLGDSVTTDHISPAGSIARNSPAARHLASLGLTPRQFNSYGSRRGNDAVMARGTFANVRLVNRLLSDEMTGRIVSGPRTRHLPSNQLMDIFDAAERYRSEGRSLIVLAGKEYGCGSSRDWAAKGPFLLGVRAVIAESYERIHRSNLVGMGVVPLQFSPGQNIDSLHLSGREIFSVRMPRPLVATSTATVTTDDGKQFNVLVRFDTEVELKYHQHGGILNYMIRKIMSQSS